MTIDFFVLLGEKIFPILIALAPLVGAALLLWIGFKVRLHYKNAKDISKMKWVMLQIKIPKEIHKSPQAMELVINSFYQTFPGDWYKLYWVGMVRGWFSLEIVSIGGNVYFMMYIPAFFKNLIESQIYAQYPQAEINEVEDYTKAFPEYKKDGTWEMWAAEFGLTQPDPYPIKTYIDYGLDKAVGSLEEFERIDPITPMMEFMGHIGPDEQIWIQILVRATMKEYHKPGTWRGTRKWKKYGEDLVKELKEKSRPKKEGEQPLPLTQGEKDKISSIERSISKLGFDTGIRGIYLAKKGSFNAANISGLIGSLRQYGSASLNGFAPTAATGFKFPWQDITGKRTETQKKLMLDAYKRRSFFYPPHKKTPSVLNSEELATIYHFPGQVSETPSFKRIEFKKSEPPANLPT
ncbi:hypothetical protein COB64_01730 [Candidatus Wolfebacteria bacterium]|nr:MAG: hypothetical protein COB64_01730 [Candidatus Wolfebacteria bacterium]